VIGWLGFLFGVAVFVHTTFYFVRTFIRLHLAGLDLYLAGKWVCQDIPAQRQAALWTRFRDALGLLEGTATALGVGDADTTTYNNGLRHAIDILLLNNGGPTDTPSGPYVFVRRSDFDALARAMKEAA
jgi:hypothetical protein